ncbi:MAG: aminotransferase class V-fold PLP-dependent enzyme [Verrucomicrobiaceae bacterium]|nr:aminotransferase class V-fold PLP-dependent enzyme [Verrucomicrobiaceae bacterium]
MFPLTDFPTLQGRTYLNTAAESIPPRQVGEALTEYWQDKTQGMAGRDPHFAKVEACREIAAKLVGLQPAEVAFCSCSSEAYNLLASALRLTAQDEVVVTDLDFPAGATPWLVGDRPPKTQLWCARDGQLLLDDLLPLLNERTRLVQVSLVSFLNGWRIDWVPLRDLVRRYAPEAILSVDVTQALGRVDVTGVDADILISSTHKWTLGIHGGCVVGVPEHAAAKLTTQAGGWYHITNAFDADRFDTAKIRKGAASFSVGMPSFAPIYALNAALRYLDGFGIQNIAAYADPLVAQAHEGLKGLGIQPMAPAQPTCSSGILAFQHPDSAKIAEALLAANIHVMHHAGRIRIALHGYNAEAHVIALLSTMRQHL